MKPITIKAGFPVVQSARRLESFQKLWKVRLHGFVPPAEVHTAEHTLDVVAVDAGRLEAVAADFARVVADAAAVRDARDPCRC